VRRGSNVSVTRAIRHRRSWFTLRASMVSTSGR
jgi:hypothetical protein